MRYFIKTFGCQQNKSDSEIIEGDYQARGYKSSPSWKTADEIIVNTCAVRQRAEDRARGFLVNVVKYFNELNLEKPKIILTGCMTHHGNRRLTNFFPLFTKFCPSAQGGFTQ